MSISNVFSSKEQILDTLKSIQKDVEQSKLSPNKNDELSFIDHLYQATKDVNKTQVIADSKAVELSTGRNGNIHETMLAATQAEISLNLIVQIRNKALEAYNEIMRMPV